MQPADERRHELNNLLSVALANVEAMIDGVIDASTERLEAIADSLRRAAELLESGR